MFEGSIDKFQNGICYFFLPKISNVWALHGEFYHLGLATSQPFAANIPILNLPGCCFFRRQSRMEDSSTSQEDNLGRWPFSMDLSPFSELTNMSVTALHNGEYG